MNGKIIRDANGKTVYEPGLLKKLKAIGWYIEEYGTAQVSCNLTDLAVTALHEVYEAICQRAATYGVKVTGSELVGLVPLNAMLDAGRHFLRSETHNTSMSEREIVLAAVKALGLDELEPFEPDKKIIEYLIGRQ